MMIERVNNELLKELNQIVIHELKDPRLAQIVGITAVETAKDLKTAKVFVSVMDENSTKEVLKVLNGAAAFIRSSLFDRLKIRTVPYLTFVKDNSISHSFKIEQILKEINKNGANNGDNHTEE